MHPRNLLAAAIAADDSETLDTIFIKTQRGYSADATENSRDYSAFAATVGTKIPVTQREIPQSISIVTNQQIKDRNVETLDQLARKTPGLRVLSNDDGRSSVYARGYEYDEYNVDGLPAQMQSINGTLPNLAAFDRVEVMRGPSGLFDSSGEMGGIVNLVRKRPGDSFAASANAGYGTDKQYKLGGDVSGKLNGSGSVRGRVLFDTSGKSPKPAKQNNHHETAYAALDWDIGPDTTAGVGYLYQQRHISPDNGLPAYKNGKLLPLPQKSFTGANWNRFEMQSHDAFADVDHYFANGAYGKIGLRYSDRDAESNYAFAGSALDDQLQVTPTGLGTNIKQKALAFDASYSQPFNWGAMRNEYVVGPTTTTSKPATNKAGRARSAPPATTVPSAACPTRTSSATPARAAVASPAHLTKKPLTKQAFTANSLSARWKTSRSSAAVASAITKSRAAAAPPKKNATARRSPAMRASSGTSAKPTASTPATARFTARRPRLTAMAACSNRAGATKSKSATKAATSATASTPASASTACKTKTPPPASPATTTTTPRSASASCRGWSWKRAARSLTAGASTRATAI